MTQKKKEKNKNLQPEIKLIKIKNNKKKIRNCLKELIVAPRQQALKWSKVTMQTPNLKIGYPGQHLASLITGMRGLGTAARGHDLEDMTEVKSCSRVDQLDTCKGCNSGVPRNQARCSACFSGDIRRNNDSKWLFAVKDKHELKKLVETKRILLLLLDYPGFEKNNFSTISLTAYEIWNQDPACGMFKALIEQYYQYFFLEHNKRNRQKTPAPKNFWPYSFQFYKCAPRKTFYAEIVNADSDPAIYIKLLYAPEKNRADLAYEKMPTNLLSKKELDKIINDESSLSVLKNNGSTLNDKEFEELKMAKKDAIVKKIPDLPYELYEKIPLRPPGKIAVAKNSYRRRKIS